MAKRDAYKQAAKSRKNAGAHQDKKKANNKKACREKVEDIDAMPTVEISTECGECPLKEIKKDKELGYAAYCKRYKVFCQNELTDSCYMGVLVVLRDQLTASLKEMGLDECCGKCHD